MPDLDITKWLLYMVLGAVTSLDAVSWPQAMISRPVVSATAGGALLGDPLAGFLVGGILELVTLRHLPLGAARYPDTGAAGVLAGAAAAAAGGPAGLAVAAVCGWIVAWMGAGTVGWMRKVNVKLVAGSSAEELSARPVRLERRHRLATGLDAVRGAVLAGTLLVPVVALARVVPPAREGTAALALAAGLAGALAAGAGAGAGTLAGNRREVFLVALGAGGMLVLRSLL